MEIGGWTAMTEIETGMKPEAPAKASRKTAPMKGKKPALKKAAGSARGAGKGGSKAGRTKTGLPKMKSVSFEDAREELMRTVCGYSGKITKVLVDEALEGKVASAKFLFEAVGLCEIRGDELEEAGERESLLESLMKQWQLPTKPDGKSETAGDPVTEVLQPVRDVALAEQAPVES
jgi:hypothetical protein